MTALVFLVVALATGPASGRAQPVFEPLPAGKLAALKKEPCTLIHVWATWCTTCLTELPDLLRALAAEKRVRPIVIDVSAPFIQDNFSKKYITSLKPAFKTYLKPEGKDEPYLSAIDKDWSGSLPFSALYDKGRRKKVWNGSIDLAKLGADIAANCDSAAKPVK